MLRTFPIKTLAILFSLLGVSPAYANGETCQALKDSGPVIATKNGQIIENLNIKTDGQTGIVIGNVSGVIVRNVRISHKGGQGIQLTNAPNTTIQDVLISYDDAPAAGPNPGEFDNITGYGSPNLTVTRAKLLHGSGGIYLDRSPGAKLSFIEGEDFRGPFPRGQFVQFNNCSNSSLTDFSYIGDRNKIWTEDNINLYQSSNMVIARGLVDGNNSPSGVGVIADYDSHNSLIEDVDALNQGQGCFSANMIEGAPPVSDITFNRVRCRDNSIKSFQNRGKAASNGLAFAANPDAKRIAFLNSVYYDLANSGNVYWKVSATEASPGFSAMEFRKEDFTPRTALGLKFCWEPDPVPAPAETNTIQLSDLNIKQVSNGWGPFERDMSNGDSGAKDGRALRMDGKAYPKGLGVHADSDLRVPLDGKCSLFKADIGLDTEVGNGGVVVFTVLGDGKQLYKSPVLSGELTPVVPISIDVTGVKELALQVDKQGDASNDHADWGNARVQCGTATESSASQTVMVTDLKPTSSKQTFGEPKLNRAFGGQVEGYGNPLRVGGATYAIGLGAHADSELHYALGQSCQRFTAQVGVDDEEGDNGAVEFRVMADNQVIYRSGTVTGKDGAKPIDVDVSGRNDLSLVVDSLGDLTSDHADWLQPKLSCTTPPPADTTITDSGNQTVYVSDLKETYQQADWGGMERDRSHGEEALNDGHTISIAGKKFDKGLGVHSNSQVDYALDKQCSRFTALVGIDDEVGNHGSVRFIVKADDQIIYKGETMVGGKAAQPIDVDVTSKTKLSLIVDKVEDNYYDHADWADAKLSCKKASTVTLDVSDLTPTAVTNGYGPMEKDRSNGESAAGDGHTLSLGGVKYAKGLGIHADSKVDYNLAGKCSAFTAQVGVDDEVGANGSISFAVLADGKEVYRSGVLKGGQAGQAVSVNLQGATTLSLVANMVDNPYSDHGDWANPKLTCKN